VDGAKRLGHSSRLGLKKTASQLQARNAVETLACVDQFKASGGENVSMKEGDADSQGERCRKQI
jgi:hypothetical protein